MGRNKEVTMFIEEIEETENLIRTVDLDNTVVYKNKEKFFHRLNGPAIIYSDGTKYWMKHGECHREDGPAIECANGNKFWYQNGKRHRTDGPAVEYADGHKEYWIEGKEFCEIEYNSFVKNLK